MRAIEKAHRTAAEGARPLPEGFEAGRLFEAICCYRIREIESELATLEAFKQLLATYFAAFDLHRANELLIAEGDKVVAYDTYRVKHTGEFAGIPPTGKS